LKIVAIFVGVAIGAMLMSGCAQAPQAVQVAPQQGGSWDFAPHSIKAAELTPASHCDLLWKGRDGASFGQVVIFNSVLFVVAKEGQGFPEFTPYAASLSNGVDRVEVSMQPQAGRSLSAVMSFQNDPHGLMPRLINGGFRLQVSGASAGPVLDEVATPVPPMVGLGNSVCIGMLRAAQARQWKPPPVAPKP